LNVFETEKQDSHTNAAELIKADNGVVLRDEEGKLMAKG